MELDDKKIKALENFCRKEICSDKILELEDKKERTEYHDNLSKSMAMYSKQEENPIECQKYRKIYLRNLLNTQKKAKNECGKKNNK